MRIIQLWLTLFSIFLLPFTGSAQEKDTCLSGHLPGYPLPKGVSAPFAGFIGDWLVVAGGCNFPDIPASEGGKRFITARDMHWTHMQLLPNGFPSPTFHTPLPMAHP